ncbi:MAG: GntR family transcriptional regulator [Ruminococcus sp.]|nr:GntR family transcriptional regulator [Candidatus Apopatosoma intestinale]
MAWTFQNTLPIYYQIADVLRTRIFCGEYPPGSRMPSVRDVALETATNPNTVVRAFALLEEEGLIAARRTLGYFVTEDDETVSRAKTEKAIQMTNEYRERMGTFGFRAEDMIRFLSEDNKEDS